MADPVLDAIDIRVSQALVGKTATWGEVIATAPLTIRINGETQNLAWPSGAVLVHYTPTTGDTVAIQKFGSRWTIVGEFP